MTVKSKHSGYSVGRTWALQPQEPRRDDGLVLQKPKQYQAWEAKFSNCAYTQYMVRWCNINAGPGMAGASRCHHRTRSCWSVRSINCLLARAQCSRSKRSTGFGSILCCAKGSVDCQRSLTLFVACSLDFHRLRQPRYAWCIVEARSDKPALLTLCSRSEPPSAP